jgi:hypothetical protein
MRESLRGRLALLMFLAGALIAPTLAAQSIGARFVVAHSSHSVLGGLVGGGLGVVLPFHPKLSGRIDIERIAGTASRIGVTCAGLVDPSVCLPEPQQASGRSTSAMAGITYEVVGKETVALGLLAAARFAQLHSQIRGTESGRMLTASKKVVGAEAGPILTLIPRRKSIFSLELGGALGAMTPVRNEQVLDGYTPFSDSSTLARLWVGVNIRLRSGS